MNHWQREDLADLSGQHRLACASGTKDCNPLHGATFSRSAFGPHDGIA